ncbi:MAG: tetratricopeptide repeat protein [Bradymonadaceae bacterium]
MHHGLLLALLSIGLVACANAQKLGDRAFESGEYQRALDHYDDEIERGSRDPVLYHRAATSATRVGGFASAERYYSQSLRYGGGLEVARDLAQFYIQTSNYAQAVRVFQYLLNHEDDPQPVYNNLGTALMYAEMPFDAEAYLLVAQQMNPGDPVPYINLGLLYDRHFKQPALAMGFYSCYLELTKDGAQARTVRMRVDEIAARDFSFNEHFAVPCGEPYRPVLAPGGRLRADFGLADGSQGPGVGEVIDLGLPGDGEDEAGELVIEKPRIETRPQVDGPRQTIAPAIREDFERGRYDEVVAALKAHAPAALGSEGQAMLGIALMKTGEFDEARPFLQTALEESPRRPVVEALFAVYERLGQKDELALLCKRFRHWPDFEDLIELRCPEGS